MGVLFLPFYRPSPSLLPHLLLGRGAQREGSLKVAVVHVRQISTSLDCGLPSITVALRFLTHFYTKDGRGRGDSQGFCDSDSVLPQ